MTDLQQKIYKIIKKHHDQLGYAPTTTDLASTMKVTRQTVEQHINALIKKGYLKKPRKGILLLGDNSLV